MPVRLASLLALVGLSFTPCAVRGGDLPHRGLAPADAAAAMRLPDGFRAEVFAAEPDVTQPIAMTIDHRGRVWVAEGHSYPIKRPAGEGKDRILIFEDIDGDGRHDVRKVFADGLNLVSGLEVGFGGVFVGQAPELLFFPDADGDDVPDGPPETLLDGWGMQDTHETLNSFIWGPDGWLHGCHGVFTHSTVGPPGTPEDQRVPINAGIWRYHPGTRAFEVFAHGTSNPWGVDFDERGQCFETACVIPHLYHMIPGGRYFRQAGRHFDPHVYEDIPTIARHRHFVGYQWDGADKAASLDYGGGHAHAGALIYQGDAWPAEYRGRLLMNNIHGARLNADSLTPRGSGFVGDRLPDFLLTDDVASQMLYLRVGPDGNAFVIDWYDTNQCHDRNPAGHDRTNGRIYRIVYDDAVTPRLGRASALRDASDADLVALLTHPNVWHRRHARRLLQERGQDEAANRALGELFASPDPLTRLRALWALTATGTLTADRLDAALSDADADVRGWAVRVASQSRPALPMSGGVPRAIGTLPPLPSVPAERFAALAKGETAAPVRLELASAAQRLPVGERWELLSALLSHGEDAGDHNLPLMLWYGFEPLVPADPQRALAVALAGEIPTVRRLALRRVGDLGTPESREALVDAAADAVGAGRFEAAREALLGLSAAVEGRRDATFPRNWERIAPPKGPWFADGATSAPGQAAYEREARRLAVRFGDPAWTKLAREYALTAGVAAPVETRRGLLDALLATRPRGLPDDLRAAIDRALGQDHDAFTADLVRALGAFDDPATPPFLRESYPRFDRIEQRAALSVLASRPAGAKTLLAAMDAGEIPRADLTADLARQIRGLGDERIAARLAAVWGTVAESDADRKALIDRYRRLLRSQDNAVSAAPDPRAGRELFTKTCAQCHELFGEGKRVGPGLTGSNRRDLDYLLSNVLDPSAVMAKDYRPTVLLTADGRTVTGLIRSETDAAVVLATADGEVAVPAADVIDRAESDVSMMPDGLLTPLSTEQVRDLFGYLRAEGPPAGAAE